jgi:hypothetical protein
MPPHNPFTTWILAPPSPTGSVQNFLEPASRDLIWKWIELLANNPTEGRKLFPGNLAAKNRLWREFHNYVRQAKAYDDAADAVTGNSSGLLQYYALLNLAKAELLITNANVVMTPPLRHGLVFQRSHGDSISGDVVQVAAGVFPLLYEKRTGLQLPLGTRLSVKRLLSHVPEIGWELQRLSLGTSTIGRLVHAVVFDATDVWAVLLCAGIDPVMESTASKARFAPHFEMVDLPQNWRDTFGFTRRQLAGGFVCLQSRWSLRRMDPNGEILSDDVVKTASETWTRLSGLVDTTTEPSYDALLSPSLLKSRWLPMPPSLARYALMFYLSSLVRYAPTKLDPRRQPDQAWLFDSFAGESHIPLLINSLNGMAEHPVLFHPRGVQRV